MTSSQPFRTIQERDFDIARAIYQRNKSTAVEGGRGLEWAALEKTLATCQSQRFLAVTRQRSKN